MVKTINSTGKIFKKLIVVVPAYNEEDGIQETITNLKGIKTKLKTKGFELFVYVVDDGSVDNTYSLAQDAGADRIIKHKTNIGLGAAVRTGLLAARKDGADVIVKFDADLQHDPNDIIALINPILNDEATFRIKCKPMMNKIDVQIRGLMPMQLTISSLLFG